MVWKLEHSVEQKNPYTNCYINGITDYVEFKNKTELHYEDVYLDDKTITKEELSSNVIFFYPSSDYIGVHS